MSSYNSNIALLLFMQKTQYIVVLLQSIHKFVTKMLQTDKTMRYLF